METPTLFIALETRTPEGQRKLKKALSDLKKLDREAAALERNLSRFSHNHSFCAFPAQTPHNLHQLRTAFAGWKRTLRNSLPRQK